MQRNKNDKQRTNEHSASNQPATADKNNTKNGQAPNNKVPQNEMTKRKYNTTKKGNIGYRNNQHLNGKRQREMTQFFFKNYQKTNYRQIEMPKNTSGISGIVTKRNWNKGNAGNMNTQLPAMKN